MHKLASVLIVIGAALADSLASQAPAQATRTWVSGVGDDSATGPQMILAVRDSAVVGNAVTGILSNTSAANTLVRVAIDRTTVTGNATGVVSTGNGDVTIGFSQVTGNSTGVRFTAPATLRTYQTNQIRGNIVDNGTFSDIIPLE